MTPEPTLDERIAAAETDLLNAETYKQRNTAAAALDALNGQKLAQVIAERDREAAEALTRGWSDDDAAGASAFINGGFRQS
jgi:flagellar motility protein MotE (MotC chaperone)